MVLVIITIIDKDDLKSKATGFIAASIGWRLLYLSYNGVQYASNGFQSDFIASLGASVQFALLFGLISAGIALAVHYLDKAVVKTNEMKIYRKISPVLSLITLAIAIVLTLLA